ncbi:MAG: hypothetical protein KDE09_04885 [Anaerolineales bacterium]|nr:hypothetical protein [Anaerolineales bacterium]
MAVQIVIEVPIDSDGDGVNDYEDAFPNDPTRAVSCEPGFYGAFTCQPAPVGTYVPTAGALVATPCPVGRFSDVEGAVACQPAQPGYFVDFVGAAAPIACSPGTYQSNSGQNSCTLADPGYFVATAAAIAQTACPAGYTSAAGAIECYRINTAPTAVPGGPYLAAVNETILLDGSASTDPEGDTLTESWTALDGSVNGSAYAAGAEAGIYDVCLTVNDGDLDSETVCTMVVVYDPGAGFVTGGGWINSPAGAYTADPHLTGKATFGFVARYKKGANVPDGSTNFQFQVGDLHFESTSYDWLVVAGSSAQFKGEGTINGSGSYQFMIWAGDGSPDTFRIRIWGEGGTIYDNGSQQLLGGGSVVVHSK